MKTIYIAGKVSGEPIHEVTMKFGKAQHDLEALGFKAINPLEVVNDWHATWQHAMKLCIKEMMTADAVLFLPDYTKSQGAMLEFYIVKNIGITAYFNIKDIN